MGLRPPWCRVSFRARPPALEIQLCRWVTLGNELGCSAPGFLSCEMEISALPTRGAVGGQMRRSAETPVRGRTQCCFY